MSDLKRKLTEEEIAISKKFKKISQLEHIKLRPDTYVGSTTRSPANLLVFRDGKIVSILTDYSPALFTIVNEALCNTLDEAQREGSKVTNIQVLMNETTITVSNNGSAIPICLHPDHPEIHVPTLIFGHLLSGTNYDDDEERTGIGRNGLGIKLANIFSTEFRLRVVKNGKSFRQTWREGMTVVSEPKIRDCDEDGSVEVQFTPDASIFGVISDEIRQAIHKRALDLSVCASILGARVDFNGERVEMHLFEEYAKLYGNPIAVDTTDDKWSVAVYLADDLESSYALVNGQPCPAGHHINRTLDILVAEVVTSTTKKAAGLKAADIKRQLRVVVMCTVVNPSFDSQLKTYCSWFDSAITWEPSKKMMKAILSSHLLDDLKAESKAKELKKMARATDGQRTQRVSVDKLRDATLAGTAQSGKCTLFLCEGDSANSFCIAGIGALDPQLYGSFPLKGKPLNVREAAVAALAKNEELTNIKKILGLKQEKKHTNGEGLRYGKVVILSDADADGLHIRGLVLNIFSVFWPSLLECGFVQFMPTPAVKVTYGTTALEFETQSAFHEWEANGAPARFNAKHVKGLGTLTLADAKVLFPKKRFVTFEADDDSAEAMLKAFDKKKADERKELIQLAVAEPQASDYGQPTMTISDFIRTDWSDYSVYSLQRAIPSMVDGLKVSQRKILFTVFKRGLWTKEKQLRVAQLAGAVSELTLYSHGEASLTGAITKMAQDFAGSNNLPLLYPEGMFGSRLQNGDDAASPRYVYTYAQPYLKDVFSKDDDTLLSFTPVEGELVEPNFYLPCIPLILVNGASGIATGYSTDVPQHEPSVIIKAVEEFLATSTMGDDGDVSDFEPGFLKWNGVYENGTFKGLVDLDTPNSATITEVPPGISFNKFEEILGKAKGVSLVSNTSTESDACFEISMDESWNSEEDLIKHLKLVQKVSTTNMWLFDTEGKLKKYSSTKQILIEWCLFRLQNYEKRLAYLREKAAADRDVATAKSNFILMVAKREIDLYKQTPAQFEALCEAESWIKVDDSWDYLLALPLRSLTVARAEALKKDSEAAQMRVNELETMDGEDLWKADLAALKKSLNID